MANSSDVRRLSADRVMELFMVRAAARPAPRLGVTLAGVGVAMMVLGTLIWPGDEIGAEGEGGGRWLGVVLSAALLAAGYGVLLRWSEGPLGTAGVAATTLAVPLLLGFATFDSDLAFSEEEASAIRLPFHMDVVMVVSIVVWMASYLFVPGARGHNFYVAATTFVLWLYVLEKVDPGSAGYLLSLPFGFFFFFEGEEAVLDPTKIGVASMAVGALYYGLSQWLDRGGSKGTATPFYAMGFVAIGFGIAHVSADADQIGTGLILLTVSPLLVVLGVKYERRFTAWIWGLGVGLGLLLFTYGILESSPAGFGLASIVLGLVLVAVAQGIAPLMGETGETGPEETDDSGPPPPASPEWTRPVAGPLEESG